MSYIEGIDRQQSTLFPELLDDYIGTDNPVRFIDAYVERLDLKQLGFAHGILQETGRPPYNPADLLKLYIYGYLNKTRSSRQLEKATHRNVEVMWLLHKLVPDFKTIADFRKDNVEALKRVFREFTLLCKDLDLFGCELVAIDGSKFSAVNHTSKTYTRKRLQKCLQKIDEKIAEYLTRLDTEDKNEELPPTVSPEQLKELITNLQDHKQWLEELQQQLDQSGETQISLTDPESRLMRTGHKGKDVCYNVQFAVDDKHDLVAEIDVTNDTNDENQLSRMAIKAKEALKVDALSVVTDMGYYKETEMERCRDAHVTCYVSEPNKSHNKKLGLFTNKDFRYDAELDCYICPANHQLTYRTECIKRNKRMRFYEGTICKSCQLRSQCTRSKRNNRRIERWEHEEVIEELRQRMFEHPEMVKKRKTIVEHPFGSIKHWMDQGYLLLRGKTKVAAEMSLTVLAYNMKRVINILGVVELINLLKVA